MALHLVATRGRHSWAGMGALIVAEGSASHAQARRLCEADRRDARFDIAPYVGEPRAASCIGERRFASPGRVSLARRIDLADAVHGLCAVHGAHRGLAEEAREHPAAGSAASWLGEVAVALANERALLVRTVAAAGPLPSTPGQAATDAAFAAQRHAFQMLARSDRVGVATGAAAALALDWTAMRAVIERAAEAYGLILPAPTLPSAGETAAVLDRLADGAGVERALLFGARALLDQHRALWSLLEARAGARRG